MCRQPNYATGYVNERLVAMNAEAGVGQDTRSGEVRCLTRTD